MSYDVHMVIKQDDLTGRICECGNYTYNVSKMYYDVLPDGLNGLHDKRGHEAAPLLDAAISKMECEPDKYRAMNPENGWGNYEGALNFLRQIRRDCGNYPNAYVSIS